MSISKHARRSIVLDVGWESRKIPVECQCLVAAGGSTRSPVWLKSPRNADRHPTTDER